MVLRLFFFCLFIIFLPLIFLIFILCAVAFGIFYLLLRLGLIKSSLIFNSKVFEVINQNKSAFHTNFRQINCKHHNLEQREDIIMCSDCGKIIQHS